VSAERIKSWPTKERPRERLLAEGPERLTDADLLAINERTEVLSGNALQMVSADGGKEGKEKDNCAAIASDRIATAISPME
jgi:hypothetical protein